MKKELIRNRVIVSVIIILTTALCLTACTPAAEVSSAAPPPPQSEVEQSTSPSEPSEQPKSEALPPPDYPLIAAEPMEMPSPHYGTQFVGERMYITWQQPGTLKWYSFEEQRYEHEQYPEEWGIFIGLIDGSYVFCNYDTGESRLTDGGYNTLKYRYCETAEQLTYDLWPTWKVLPDFSGIVYTDTIGELSNTFVYICRCEQGGPVLVLPQDIVFPTPSVDYTHGIAFFTGYFKQPQAQLTGDQYWLLDLADGSAWQVEPPEGSTFRGIYSGRLYFSSGYYRLDTREFTPHEPPPAGWLHGGNIYSIDAENGYMVLTVYDFESGLIKERYLLDCKPGRASIHGLTDGGRLVFSCTYKSGTKTYTCTVPINL